MKGYCVRVKSDPSIDRLLAERGVRNVRPAQVRGPRDSGDEKDRKRETEKPAELTVSSTLSTPILSECTASVLLWHGYSE